MLIDVEEIPGSAPEGWWYLTLNGRPLIGCACVHAAKQFARRLDTASRAPYRDAMRILTEEIGYCESVAGEVYLMLQGAPPTSARVN